MQPWLLTAKLGGIFICPVSEGCNFCVGIYLSLLVNGNGPLRGDKVKAREYLLLT